jgi:hypothetical protein
MVQAKMIQADMIRTTRGTDRMKTLQIVGACALVLAIATACKREPEATPAPAPTTSAADAAANLPVDATSAVDNTAAADTAGPALDAKALAGSFSDGESVLELRADGSYVQTLQAGGNAISTDGSWSAAHGDGLLLDPNSKSAADVRFQVVSIDELRSGDGSRTFRRIAGR